MEVNVTYRQLKKVLEGLSEEQLDKKVAFGYNEEGNVETLDF